MSRQYWNEQLAWATADGTAVHTSVAETILFPDITIPGNYMNDGRTLRLRAFGRVSTTGTPTIIFRLRWGGVAGVLMAMSETITTGTGLANANWSIEFIIQTRTNGATGTIFTMGDISLHSSATAATDWIVGISGWDAPTAATCDLTIDKALSLTVQWGTSSASNTITGHMYNLESLN